MATPKTTIWDLEPHTRAKHAILKRYLQAWMPILSQGGFPEFIYIDGFAGPGIYSKGEEGSPVIAIKAATEQPKPIRSNINFLFIEKDPKRVLSLKEVVDGLTVPSHFKRTIDGNTFDAAFSSLVSARKVLPPTLAFIDPFGWAGVPFETVRKVLAFPSCEVLITFMYEEINRFLGHPDQVENFNSFFGTEEWKTALATTDPAARNRLLHDLYLRQLKTVAGARYVRSFQMRNDKDVTDYYLFFATNNLTGLARMKEAMWKVDPAGEFKFSDSTDPNQLMLFSSEPSFDQLKRKILDRFRGKEATVEGIEEFVLSETAFRETHYKQQVLKVLELANPAAIEIVEPPSKRRRGTYSDGKLRIRFHP